MSIGKSGYLERLKNPPREDGARRESMDALLQNCRVGIKVQKKDKKGKGTPEFEQNYIAYSITPFGQRMFIHGRELFKNEAAYKKFISKEFEEKDLPDIFTEAALERLKNLHRPETFEDRLMPMFMPEDRLSYGQIALAEYKKNYPGVDFSSVPEPTHDNIEQVLQIMMGLVEQHTSTPGKVYNDTPAYTENANEKLKKLVKEGTDKTFDRIIDIVLADNSEAKAKALSLKNDLRPYVQKNNYDPLIYENFAVGIEYSPEEERNIEKLIERGIQVGAYRIAINCCFGQHMGNPFGEELHGAEKKTAQTLAQMVHPRVVKEAIRQGTAFVAVDAENIKPATDLLMPMHLDHLGRFEHHQPSKNKIFNDIVVVTSEELNQKKFAIYARHEAAHMIDMTSTQNFCAWYGQNGKGELEKDKAHIDNCLDTLHSMGNPPNAEETKEILRLGRKLQIRGTKTENPKEVTVAHIRDKVIEAVEIVQARARTFLPGAEAVSDSYGTQGAQLNEVPAVVQELKGAFGREFAREMLPNLYPLVMRHQVQHPGLRNNPSQGRS